MRHILTCRSSAPDTMSGSVGWNDAQLTPLSCPSRTYFTTASPPPNRSVFICCRAEHFCQPKSAEHMLPDLHQALPASDHPASQYVRWQQAKPGNGDHCIMRHKLHSKHQPDRTEQTDGMEDFQLAHRIEIAPGCQMQSAGQHMDGASALPPPELRLSSGRQTSTTADMPLSPRSSRPASRGLQAVVAGIPVAGAARLPLQGRRSSCAGR